MAHSAPMYVSSFEMWNISLVLEGLHLNLLDMPMISLDLLHEFFGMCLDGYMCNVFKLGRTCCIRFLEFSWMGTGAILSQSPPPE